MKDNMPTWPQMLVIMLFATAAVFCGYFLSRTGGEWGASAWALLALFLLSCAGFLVAVLLFYLRPQYGPRAVPFLIAFMLGHFLLVALLWAMGVLG